MWSLYWCCAVHVMDSLGHASHKWKFHLLRCGCSGFLLAPQLYSCAFIILRIHLEYQNNGWANHAKRWTSLFQKLQCSPKLQLHNQPCSEKTSLHRFYCFFIFWGEKQNLNCASAVTQTNCAILVFALFQPPWQDLPTYKWSKHSQLCTITTRHRDQTSWVSLGFFWLRCKLCCCFLETDMSGAVPPNYGSHAEFSIGIWNCQFININLYFGPRM